MGTYKNYRTCYFLHVVGSQTVITHMGGVYHNTHYRHLRDALARKYAFLLACRMSCFFARNLLLDSKWKRVFNTFRFRCASGVKWRNRHPVGACDGGDPEVLWRLYRGRTKSTGTLSLRSRRRRRSRLGRIKTQTADAGRRPNAESTFQLLSCRVRAPQNVRRYRSCFLGNQTGGGGEEGV